MLLKDLLDIWNTKSQQKKNAYIDKLNDQNIRIFLQKVAHQIGRKKFLLLKELKIYLQWTYVKEDLKDKEIVGMFYVKELQKINL